MLTYIRNRLLTFIPVILGVSILVFLMIHFVPGDPVVVMTSGAPLPKEEMDRLREQMGLNDPLIVQYGRFLSNVVQGDLGRSLRTNRPVIDDLLEQAPHTIELAIASMGIAILVGGMAGVFAARRRNSWLDTATTSFALVGVSMPIFWLGLVLIFVFAFWLDWLPATGQGSLKQLILPALALAWYLSGIIARLVRSSMLEVMQADFVQTAKAKGLRPNAVYYKHALRNALIPVITVIGVQFGNLLAGTVIVETVFARQGLGRYLVQGILQKDFPVVQGAVLFTSFMYLAINLFVDISYAAVDPRIRYK